MKRIILGLVEWELVKVNVLRTNTLTTDIKKYTFLQAK